METMRIGFVGGGRPCQLWTGMSDHPELRMVAGCNNDPEWVRAFHETDYAEQKGLKGLKMIADYDEMLEKEALDVVIVGTGMDQHVPMSIKAMKHGIDVVSEVTASVSVAESRELVKVQRETGRNYILAENGLFLKENVLVSALVDKGLFGETYYAEGEYLHQIRIEASKKAWRRNTCHDVNGVTYGTHPLGPILRWMGERVARVCCVGSGYHHRDKDGIPFKGETSPVMLCKTTSGKLIKIRCDITSDRPHATTNFMLQGADGCYESSRIDKYDGPYRIWLRSMTGGEADNGNMWEKKDTSGEPEWESLWNYEENLTDIYKTDKAKELVSGCGHRGSDYFTGYAIGEILLGKRENILDIHHAMDMTLPGLLSQESCKRNGEWVEVPDSREW